MAERDKMGRVKAGTGSLNPGGRPKSIGEVTDLARAHTTEAIEALAEIMRGSLSDSCRIAAAESLLSRAWGKAPATTESDEGEQARPLMGLTPAQLVEIVKAGGH